MTGQVTVELEKNLHLREPAGDWNVQIGPEEQIKFSELFEYKKKYERLKQKVKKFVDIARSTDFYDAREQVLSELETEIK